MKVLLINPWYPIKDFFYRVSRITPPLGIAYMASVLEQQGYSVKILDMLASDMKYEELGKHIAAECPDVVGMTASSPTIDYASECSSIVRNHAPNAKIVIGGPHPTLLPKETFERITAADFILRGESENTFVQLLRHLEKGLEHDLQKIEGIGIRKPLVISDEIALIEDLDSLPFPAFDLLDMDAYYETNDPSRRFFPMMSSRGCPYSCIFCNTPTLHGRRFRFRSARNVVEEMKILAEKYKVQHILFYDDTFTMDMTRAESICDEIHRNQLSVSWRIRTRVDRVNQRLLYKLKKAGCNVISYGVETSSNKFLDVLEKKYTIDDVRKAFRMTKEAGIKILGYFILGIPGETKDDVKRTIEFAKSLEPDYALFNILTPLPGSKSYDMIRENITSHRWADYRSGVKSVVTYRDLSNKELEGFIDQAYQSFYIRKEWLTSRIRRSRSIEEIENDINTFFFYLENGRFILPLNA